jgi:hypothetical protein
MSNTNKYISEWQNYISKMKEALEEKDFAKFDTLNNMVNEVYQKYKEDVELTYDCQNFGMAEHIFEDALPNLFKTNKKAVKEYIKTIKEDKNLLSQFQFFDALKKYNCDSNGKEYVNELLSLALENIDYKTVNESNSKLYNIIKKYDIKPSKLIDNEEISLYENCNFILTKKKKVSNLTEMTNSIKSVGDYIENHKTSLNENSNNVYSLIDEYDTKYNSMLTEEEKTFVQELIDAKSAGASQRKEKLFNKFKNECISIVNTMLNECDSESKEQLLEVKEQLLNKEFCHETLIKDMANLLEIRDILLNK